MILRRNSILVGVLLTLAAGPAWSRPTRLQRDRLPIESSNRRFVGLPDPGFTKMTVYRRSEGKNEEVWTFPEWPMPGFLSDDGDYLVVGDGGTVRPRDYKPSLPVLRFYKRGVLIKTVTLGEVIGPVDLDSLSRADNQWGFYDGFTAPYLFSIATRTQQRFTYDVSNGLVVKMQPSGETYVLDDDDPPPTKRRLPTPPRRKTK